MIVSRCSEDRGCGFMSTTKYVKSTIAVAGGGAGGTRAPQFFS